MKKLILSTGNKNKALEIREILEDLNIEVYTKDQVGLKDFDVVEDKDSLEGNAVKKAYKLSEKVDGIVMADDTGLFVEALNGQPGVLSARYAGEEGNDQANKDKLLSELEGLEGQDRKAYFETVIALVTKEGKLETISGICRGTIAKEERGQGGFGYDPVFIPEGYDQSFAELGHEVKNKISHRALALEKMRTRLVELLED